MKNIQTSHANKSGYIMIFSLLVIAAAMVIVAYVGYKGSVHSPYMKMSIAREKAKLLAMSGVNIAIAQLAKGVSEQENGSKQPALVDKAAVQSDKKDGKGSSDEDKEQKDFLQRILPTLNRWQIFELTAQADGIEAELKICLMSEEGKINLNRIYNFKKEKFRGDKEKGWQAIFPELCKNIEKISKMTDLFTAFEKAFKERRNKYNDATELVVKKEFNGFKDLLFYEPFLQSSDKKDKQAQQIYLTDIFTVWSTSGKIEPWLFSHSLAVILGLTSVEGNDVKNRTEQVSQWLKNFKQKADWQKDWQSIMQPIYGKELRSLPKNIDSMLNETFDPHFFSVRVHARVDQVTQRVYAILERNKRSQDSDGPYDITLKKLYWL